MPKLTHCLRDLPVPIISYLYFLTLYKLSDTLFIYTLLNYLHIKATGNMLQILDLKRKQLEKMFILQDAFYSHKNYFRPELQDSTHKVFDNEVLGS